ncbi:sideroflexin-5-like isoform X2 [Xenopus laevis]|uniref:Uncharacterized protein n=2 Tax=Xenopus laevis TaxID=8355 RepID=A0A974HZX4_XENLA|nr:sideroflexin-5-like isoform X2 [Xenopus laevis]OCT96529.1 hypothetical protein XELAEV_18008733mg [Xenopus laevis]
MTECMWPAPASLNLLFFSCSQALLETALRRVVLPMSILVLPSLCLHLKRHLCCAHTQDCSSPCIASCAFGLALPLAISLFPHMSEIETSRLEPEIAARTSSRTVVYNKGL